MRLAATLLFAASVGCVVSLEDHQIPDMVVYSSVGTAPAVISAYTRETGRRASLVTMSTGALLARISAEAHHPRWDVVWFEGDDGAVAMDRAGLFARGTVPDLDWTPLGRTLLPADRSYEPTGFTLAGVFLERADKAHTVQNWTQAFNTKRIGMADPALSGPAYQLLAGMLSINGGWPAGQSALLRMAANGMLVAPSNAAVLTSLLTGRIDSAITQSSAGIALSRTDKRFLVALPDPAFILPGVASVAADQPASRRHTASDFLRFIMRPDIQILRMHDTDADRLFWPVTNSPAQPDLPDPDGMTLMHLSPLIWGGRQAEVIDWFQRMIVR
ncbi:ABC transporter substrate-binding protein [Acetobacter orleanensis]|uniref:ABC transporter substrate-binding protein n=1 Tax=Acetobacter orleanensis TaxID=104099 RepID=UPI00066260D3|nr:extracellular solute-binding protein [Acetobacter orleanensis]